MNFIDLERDYIIKAKKENFTIKQKKNNKLILLINIINLILVIRFMIITMIDLHTANVRFNVIFLEYNLYWVLPIQLLLVLPNIYPIKISIKNEILIIRYDLRYIKIRFKDLINVSLKKERVYYNKRHGNYIFNKYDSSNEYYIKSIHIEYKRKRSLKKLEIPFETELESGKQIEVLNQYDVYKLINNFIRKNDSKRFISHLDVNPDDDYILIRKDDTELQEVYNSKLNQIKYDVPIKYILLISFVSVLLFCIVTFVILKLTIK